jgi:hypothetical protein
MSHEVLEERVGKLETEQARQGQELRNISDKVSDVASGVKSLLDRESKRPHGVTWREFFAGIMTAVTIGGGLWWTVSGLVEHSPAVVELNKRMDQAEWKYGWAARVDTP